MSTRMAGQQMTLQSESFTSDGIAQDTRRGLQDQPKWLSSLYFYDEEGSRLFEEISRTPEYYPTRTELAILEEHAAHILAQAGEGLLLAELGSGSSRKTEVLIEQLVAQQGAGSTYMPVDVSADFLEEVAKRLAIRHPGLEVHPVAAEYGEGLHAIGATPAARRLVLFLGSSIGNFEPEEQVQLLARAHAALSPGDAFLLGVDMVKDSALLDAAYNDAAGHTAAFNRNLLVHLNRRLDGDADPRAFEHVAFFDQGKSRIEMHLQSRCDQTLSFPRAGLTVPLAAGERIHTENSYKFTPAGARRLAARAGFIIEKAWSDEREWFCVLMLRRP